MNIYRPRQKALFMLAMLALFVSELMAQSAQDEKKAPDTPAKDIYIYLDYSKTIVKTDVSRQNANLASMLQQALDSKSGFAMPQDNITIIRFGNELATPTTATQASGEWTNAVADYTNPSSGEPWTNLALVLDNIASIADAATKSDGPPKVFIIASDFFHNVSGEYKEAYEADLVKIRAKISSMNDDPFRGQSPRCFLFLLKVTTKYSAQYGDPCANDLVTKFDAGVDTQGVGGSEFAQKIRKRLLRWPVFVLKGFKANDTNYPDFILSVSNNLWCPLSLKGFGVKLAENQTSLSEYVFKPKPVDLIGVDQEVLWPTGNMADEYKREKLYLTPIMTEVISDRSPILEIANVPISEFNFEVKSYIVTNDKDPLLAVYPKLVATGIESEAETVKLELFIFNKALGESSEQVLGGPIMIKPSSGIAKYSKLITHRLSTSSDPLEYKIRAKMTVNRINWEKTVSAIEKDSVNAYFVKISPKFWMVIIGLCVLATSIPIVKKTPYNPKRRYKDRFSISMYIIAIISIVLSFYVPNTFEWIFLYVPGFLVFAIFFRLLAGFFPLNLKSMLDTGDGSKTVDNFTVHYLFPRVIVSLVLGAFSIMALKFWVFS